MSGDLPKAEAAQVVVSLQERGTGKLYVGERWEQHADLRHRCDLGERTDGWLTPGFIDLETSEFLTRSQAFRRFPKEAGRVRGHGLADSSDFECIRKSKFERGGGERREEPDLEGGF
jgi:hypothetical protein